MVFVVVSVVVVVVVVVAADHDHHGHVRVMVAGVAVDRYPIVAAVVVPCVPVLIRPIPPLKNGIFKHFD